MNIESFSDFQAQDGELFFSTNNSLELINFCKKNSYFVIGMDGYKINEGKINPILSHTFDFSDEMEKFKASDMSWKDFTNKYLTIIENYICKINDVTNLYFTFEIESTQN